MKEQMKRAVYEAPVTELFQIELEGGFMQASQLPASINEDTEIVVEEYDRFDTDITFE